jgi:hypothetical protein
MIRNKKIVETIDRDGNPLFLAITKPSASLKNMGDKVYAKAWREALDAKYILSARLMDVAKANGLWGDEQQATLDAIDERLAAAERKLKKGGIPLWGLEKNEDDSPKDTVQNICYGMLADRSERIKVFTGVNSLIEKTCETYAEAFRQAFIIANTTVYQEDQKLFFKNVDDYNNRFDEKAVQDVTDAAQELLYGIVDPAETRKSLPEFSCMLKYKLVDEKLRLIDKNGNLISLDGRRIDEEGYYLDDNGNRVADQENIDFTPFLDENGNPVEV